MRVTLDVMVLRGGYIAAFSRRDTADGKSRFLGQFEQKYEVNVQSCPERSFKREHLWLGQVAFGHVLSTNLAPHDRY